MAKNTTSTRPQYLSIYLYINTHKHTSANKIKINFKKHIPKKIFVKQSHLTHLYCVHFSWIYNIISLIFWLALSYKSQKNDMQSKTNIQKSNLLNPFRSVYKDKGTCKRVRTASVTKYHRKSRISNRVARMRKNKTSLLQKDSALFEDSYCIHLVFKQNNTHISTSSQSFFFFFANLRLMFTALAKNSKYDKGKHHLSSVEPCGPFSWSSIFHKNPDHHVVIKDYQSRLCGHVDGGTHPKSCVAELKCFLKSHSIHSFIHIFYCLLGTHSFV